MTKIRRLYLILWGVLLSLVGAALIAQPVVQAAVADWPSYWQAGDYPTANTPLKDDHHPQTIVVPDAEKAEAIKGDYSFIPNFTSQTQVYLVQNGRAQRQSTWRTHQVFNQADIDASHPYLYYTNVGFYTPAGSNTPVAIDIKETFEHVNSQPSGIWPLQTLGKTWFGQNSVITDDPAGGELNFDRSIGSNLLSVAHTYDGTTTSLALPQSYGYRPATIRIEFYSHPVFNNDYAGQGTPLKDGQVNPAVVQPAQVAGMLTYGDIDNDESVDVKSDAKLNNVYVTNYSPGFLPFISDHSDPVAGRVVNDHELFFGSTWHGGLLGRPDAAATDQNHWVTFTYQPTHDLYLSINASHSKVPYFPRSLVPVEFPPPVKFGLILPERKPAVTDQGVLSPEKLVNRQIEWRAVYTVPVRVYKNAERKVQFIDDLPRPMTTAVQLHNTWWSQQPGANIRVIQEDTQKDVTDWFDFQGTQLGSDGQPHIIASALSSTLNNHNDDFTKSFYGHNYSLVITATITDKNQSVADIASHYNVQTGEYTFANQAWLVATKRIQEGPDTFTFVDDKKPSNVAHVKFSGVRPVHVLYAEADQAGNLALDDQGRPKLQFRADKDWQYPEGASLDKIKLAEPFNVAGKTAAGEDWVPQQFTDHQQVYTFVKIDSAADARRLAPYQTADWLNHRTDGRYKHHDQYILVLYQRKPTRVPLDKTVNTGHHTDGQTGDDTEKVTTATVGHDVTWNLETGIAQNIAAAKDFIMTDQLDPRLDFSGIKGFRLGYYDSADKVATLHDAAQLDLAAGTDYTVTPAPGQGGTVTITFTPAGRQKLAASVTFSPTKFDAGGNALAYAKADTQQAHPVVLVTDLGTKVNKHVLDKGNYGPIDNKFTVTINGQTTPLSDDPQVPPIPDKPIPPNTPVTPKVPKVYFVNVGATKVSQEDNQAALAGATFAIADTAENARTGHYIQVTPEGRYVYPGDDHYGDPANQPLTQETNQAGLVTFQGLKAKDAQQADDQQDVQKDFSRAYYLVETKAPAGYGLIKKPIKVIGAVIKAADPAVVKIEDPRHTPVTPSFPAAGAASLLLLGSVIMTAGSLAVIVKKKAGA